MPSSITRVHTPPRWQSSYNNIQSLLVVSHTRTYKGEEEEKKKDKKQVPGSLQGSCVTFLAGREQFHDSFDADSSLWEDVTSNYLWNPSHTPLHSPTSPLPKKIMIKKKIHHLCGLHLFVSKFSVLYHREESWVKCLQLVFEMELSPCQWWLWWLLTVLNTSPNWLVIFSGEQSYFLPSLWTFIHQSF